MSVVDVNLIEEAFKALEALEATTSRNEKTAILENSKSNAVLQDLLRLAYDPFLKYYVVKYGEVTPNAGDKGSPGRFAEFKKLLELLSKREITGNAAIDKVREFFGGLNEQEYKWYSRVLLKDLRVGVTETTINKIWKGLVPVFECMLAKPWEDVKKKPKEVFVEPKLDGYRCIAFVDSGTVEMFTRNGKKIEGFSQVEQELKLFPDGVYDGELVGINRMFNDMQKLVFKKEDNNKRAYFCVFDVLPIEDFKAGVCAVPLHKRKDNLLKIFKNSDRDAPHIHLVLSSGPMAWNSPLVDELYSHYLDQGFEGIMVKDANSKYECKRSPSWAKIKPTDTFDLEVVGFEEGTGKNQGRLGALIVDYKGFKVNVGSGFSDQDRENLWKEREQLIGKVIEVEAQETTENQHGEESLRFPIFKRFRLDK